MVRQWNQSGARMVGSGPQTNRHPTGRGAMRGISVARRGGGGRTANQARAAAGLRSAARMRPRIKLKRCRTWLGVGGGMAAQKTCGRLKKANDCRTVRAGG